MLTLVSVLRRNFTPHARYALTDEENCRSAGALGPHMEVNR